MSITNNKVQIMVSEKEDNYHVIYEAKTMAKLAGFDETDQTLIATVASELSTNIVRYAKCGEIHLKIITDFNKTGIQIRAIDNGPGIADIDKAMQECYTTTKNSLGMGLSSLNRIMDSYNIDSEVGVGTTIITIKWNTKDADRFSL